jgi:biotin-(acetyl-CoA carboxylase) ligase
MMAGIGINLFSDEEQFGGVYETNFEFDKKIWCSEIANFIWQSRIPGVDELKSEWEKRCFHLNRSVYISEGHEDYSGLFKGLGEDGEALLFNEQGLQRIYNGTLKLV